MFSVYSTVDTWTVVAQSESYINLEQPQRQLALTINRLPFSRAVIIIVTLITPLVTRCSLLHLHRNVRELSWHHGVTISQRPVAD